MYLIFNFILLIVYNLTRLQNEELTEEQEKQAERLAREEGELDFKSKEDYI